MAEGQAVPNIHWAESHFHVRISTARVVGRGSRVPKIVAGLGKSILLNATLLPTNGCFDANHIPCVNTFLHYQYPN